MGDTIGEKKQNPLKKLVTGTVLALGVMAILFWAVGCEMNPYGFNHGPTPNVRFDRIDPTWSQEEVTNRLRLSLSQLTYQSESLRIQYTEWQTQLRGQIILGGDNTEILAQLDFSAFVQNMQDRIQKAYRRNNIGVAKRRAAKRIENLVSEIKAQIQNPQAAELFEARLTAFRLLHYIGQRELLTVEERETRAAELAEVADTITRLGGVRPSTSLTPSAIQVSTRQLRNTLELHLPDTVGTRELRGGLLQQIENFAQFDGWTNDLLALHFDLTLTLPHNPPAPST